MAKRKSADKQGMLEQKIKDLEGVLAVLYLLRDAEENERSEKATLAALGVDYSKFRYLVYYTDWGTHRHVQDAAHEKVEHITNVMPTTCWEEDLWCDILDAAPSTTNLASCPDDVQETIHVALSSLTERERLIVTAKYSDREELGEIGARLGLTKERIRQILLHAMRKLRHPRRLSYICLGQGAYVSMQQVQKNLQSDFELQVKTRMLEDISYEIRGTFERKFQNAKQAVLNGSVHPQAAITLKPKSSIEIMTLPIEELDLSIRGFNCLKRAGMKTVYDVCNCSGKELRKVRNLGKKCYDEIIEKLRFLGVGLREERSDEV